MDYQVDLDIFRGPLDLLLYLVKRDEVDVVDIPIARVAEQFVEYLAILEVVDVERAGDFLVMAATLMEIKSRMLLPRPEENTDYKDEAQLGLVRQLVEYKTFKDAAALLDAQAEKQLSRLPRQPIEIPTGPGLADQPLHEVEVWDLVSAFGRLMRETLALQPQQIVVDQTPLHVFVDNIVERLQTERRITFAALFTPPHSRSRLVGLFLALLELIKSGKVSAEQQGDFGEIWIVPVSREA
jgi:segregation and condensation protein A